MVYPLPIRGPDTDTRETVGYTYAAVLVRAEGRDEVLAALREVRFTGWLARPEDGWLVAVAGSGAGSVAAGRRGVLGLAGWLAERLAATVVAVRVLADRQLVLAVFADGTETGRYVSDPSHGLDDKDVLPDPLGAEYAAGFAGACGRPEAADDLAELLAETLDPDSVIESERLGRVLRLLGLPTWLVAAASLPGEVPTGPAKADLTRLGAGVPGLRGRLWGRAVQAVRRRRRPPPVVADPPRATAGVDPWVL